MIGKKDTDVASYSQNSKIVSRFLLCDGFHDVDAYRLLGFYTELPICLSIDGNQSSLHARAVQLDAVQPSAPFAVTLIVLSVILYLQTGGEVTGADDPHGDGQFFAMSTSARRYALCAVVGAVSTGCSIPGTLDCIY